MFGRSKCRRACSGEAEGLIVNGMCTLYTRCCCGHRQIIYCLFYASRIYVVRLRLPIYRRQLISNYVFWETRRLRRRLRLQRRWRACISTTSPRFSLIYTVSRVSSYEPQKFARQLKFFPRISLALFCFPRRPTVTDVTAKPSPPFERCFCGLFLVSRC